MWEYILDADDADDDFVYSTLDFTGELYCYDRKRRLVVTFCPPGAATKVAKEYKTRPLPALYHELTLTREALLQRMEQANELDSEDSHHMVDYLVLAYLNDPAITRAYSAREKYYA